MNEYYLVNWIYQNTESIYKNWKTFFPGYLDMPTNEDEFKDWVETAEKNFSDPADWNAWQLNFIDLFSTPTSFDCQSVEWTETIDSCNYYLALENADTGVEVTSETDPFIMHFDPAGHVLVFGSEDNNLCGE